jgi:glycosyltransferase involved in cell wall biosynthesis
MCCLAAPPPKINEYGNLLLHFLKKSVITSLRIAILGTRGIPNRYGGFEQAATYISAGLVAKGHAVTVYAAHNHPYRNTSWKGVHLIHCYDPGYMGSAGQFVYDLNCILDARKRNFDIWLFLGYTSSSVWGRLYPRNAVCISNMDGLEWKRSKYSAPVKKFLQFAEKLAVRYSHFLIADSPVIQSYLLEKYKAESTYIAYGAEIYNEQDEHLFSAYGIEKYNYYLILARMEPENNIETILDGFCKSQTEKKMMVVGNLDTAFGKYLLRKFNTNKRIFFCKPLYDAEKLHTLKLYCSLYFHGHSCGGTNPSLLEAMADRTLICAHDNPFNRHILGEDAFYFSTPADIQKRIEEPAHETDEKKMTENNFGKIMEQYNWPKIVSVYERFMMDCYNSFQR